ncbi:hypothetical protein ACB092_09G127300 [Castanea dentata]
MRMIYNSIKDIHPETRNWKVKVLVAEKTMPQASLQGVSTYQRLILIDKEGNRVQAVMLSRDIQHHEDTLIQARAYFITNALVKPIPTKLCLIDHNYQWIINTKTVIEDVLEDEILFHTTEYSFVPFNEFHKYIDLDDPIGISLSTKPSFVINPNHSKATALEEWASMNEKLLEDIIAKMFDPASSSNTSIMLPIEILTDIGAIAILPKMVSN